ncbi:MAG: copper homeostasis protein CutC [Saprospiraceae bacterium]
MLLEICANSFSSAMNAQLAGANRVELCSSLETGGLTPSAATIQLTCETLHKAYNNHLTKVHILIRPRAGDFCYSTVEVGLMRRDIMFSRECGADGLAIGLLLQDGSIDTRNIKELIKIANGMSLTFHRAFDLIPKPFEALEQLIDLGFHTILTSGQAPTAVEGQELLRQLVEKANGRIDIMPGAGIHALNVKSLADFTKATNFHLSAKRTKQKSLDVDKPDLFASAYWETDVAEVKRVLGELSS